MKRWSSPIHQVSIFLSSLGVFLLIVGAIIGWLVPWVSSSFAQIFTIPLPTLGHNIDINAFLGAYITALAVIIAVLIGYNISTLQIAGQLLSPALVRAILLSLAPFLICWSLTTYVALTYFIVPPTLMVQLLQLLLWFGAVVLLMIGYLWNLPWRLSGEHAALWSIRQLRKKPMSQWEFADGYSILQTGIASASARSDVGTVRTMALIMGDFLVSLHHERANHFDRERYRAVKNLLSGCMQNAASAPNAVAYYLGFVMAGVLLRGVAVGSAYDSERDLFSGIFRALHSDPGRLDALWTGMRHGLCRKGIQGEPYLLRFWRYHHSWATDDPRRVQFIAEVLVRFHTQWWRALGSFNREKHAINANRNNETVLVAHPSVWSQEEVSIEMAEMLADLYRYIGKYLAQEVVNLSHTDDNLVLRDLPQKLLDSIHALILQMWPVGEAEKARRAVIKAYDDWRGEMILLKTKQ